MNNDLNEMARLEQAGNKYCLRGQWVACGLHAVLPVLDALERIPEAIQLDASNLDALDTAGALLVLRSQEQWAAQQRPIAIEGWSKEHAALLDLVSRRRFAEEAPGHQPSVSYLEYIGRVTVQSWRGIIAFLGFMGRLFNRFCYAVARPKTMRFNAIAFTIQRAGYEALPITAVLAFLIGVVIAYQGGVQLSNYGANIFLVDLVGLTVLRELAPMIVAIIVAGRTGSAFTAQIGTMKVSEEVDALRSIGIDPMDLLVLPKVMGLVLVLPLLTFFGDVVGVWGGAVIGQVALGVNFSDFWDRFADAVPLSALIIGLLKAPLFALFIALIGCYQGMRVRGGADSVGQQTTLSVVHSIFAVIVLDGLIACVLSTLGI